MPRNPNPQCEHCADMHDGFYGSWASPCPIHNEDGSLKNPPQPAVKAKPVKLVYGEGYKPCSVEEATHVTLRFPGPVGLLTLPVIRSGTREGTGCWTWNGSTDAPTLRPSVLTQGRAYDDDLNDLGPYTCHSWVNDGHAQFLNDSTHEFAGKTVPLLDVERP